MSSIKKDDIVKVISGKNRGKTGQVLRSFPKKDKVLVQGVNLCKKHEKPSPKNEKGGIVEKEMPIHISNVALEKVSKKEQKDR